MICYDGRDWIGAGRSSRLRNFDRNCEHIILALVSARLKIHYMANYIKMESSFFFTCIFYVDDCPFGDQPIIPFSAGCQERIELRGFDCYQPQIRLTCCESCATQFTDVPGRLCETKFYNQPLLHQT